MFFCILKAQEVLLGGWLWNTTIEYIVVSINATQFNFASHCVNHKKACYCLLCHNQSFTLLIIRPSVFLHTSIHTCSMVRIAGSFGLVTSVQTLIPRLCLWCQPSLAMTSWRISGKCVKYIHGRQRKSSGSSDFCRIAADFPSCCRVTTGTTLVDYGGSNKYRKSLSYGYPDSGEVPKRQITPARCYRVLI